MDSSGENSRRLVSFEGFNINGQTNKSYQIIIKLSNGPFLCTFSSSADFGYLHILDTISEFPTYVMFAAVNNIKFLRYNFRFSHRCYV
jgi:hypothetical protein